MTANDMGRPACDGTTHDTDLNCDYTSTHHNTEAAVMADVPPTIVAAALEYAARGWPVFPVPPGEKKSYKSAAHSNGSKWGATTDPAEITTDFARWAGANVGIITGPVSGLLVIEADTLAGHGVDGIANLQRLIDEHGVLPPTIEARSPSGSRHLYFSYPDELVVKNSASVVAAGVDVRADGGMIIAPPGHRPGIGCYDWVCSPSEIDPASCPEWLLRRCVEAKKRENSVPHGCAMEIGPYEKAWVETTLRNVLAELLSAREGGRNEALNGAAFSVGQIVGAGLLDKGTAVARLTGAAKSIGLSEGEIFPTIDSGLTAGIKSPRGPADARAYVNREYRRNGVPSPDLDDCMRPIPLPELPEVPEFPIDLLPDDFQPWIGDAAQRSQFPPDFAAVTAMAAFGSLLGRQIGLRPKQKDDWTEHPNVWALSVGGPSSGKSPSARVALTPIRALQATEHEHYKCDCAEYAIELETHKLRKDARRKSVQAALKENLDAKIDLGVACPPSEPTRRTYWTSDANDASLSVLLAENPNGLLIERDEMSSLLASLDDERNAALRGMLLSGWSGREDYRSDRIGRGTTILPKFSVSVVGGIQPGPLDQYVRSAFSGRRADGMLQRFQLMTYPDIGSFAYVDRWPSGEAKEAAKKVFERVAKFNALTIGQLDKFNNEPPFVRFSAAAQARFIAWYQPFIQARRSAVSSGHESAAINAHFAKYPGLVAKLCLIIHVADDPASREVSDRTLLKALAWIDYLTLHAQRVYHAIDYPETGATKLLLARLKRGELPSSFKSWEVSRKCWKGLTDREAVKKACRLLCEYRWLIELDPGGPTGGRPADPIYAVSPAAKTVK